MDGGLAVFTDRRVYVRMYRGQRPMRRRAHKDVVSFPSIARLVFLHIVVVVPRLALDFWLEHALRVA